VQQLVADYRAGLTETQVRSLLGTSSSLTVSAGLELLNPDLTLNTDLSDDFEGGTVERVMGATIHGTCKLRIARELLWGSALVRPYMVLTDGLVTGRWNVGVFSLATPVRVYGSGLTTFDCQGYDRLYLLTRPVGDTYTVAAGTAYVTAVGTAIAAAGLVGVQIDSTALAKTLPRDMVWPLTGEGGATWLQVCNDLLGAIGYRGLYADLATGFFRSEPYVNPSARAVEFTFGATGVTANVGDERTETADTWNVPNKWVFVQRNVAAAPTEGAGQYTVTNQSTGLTSITSRGLTWPKVVSVDAADQASLMAQGDALVAADKRSSRRYDVLTPPFPAAGHADVYQYEDPLVAGGTVKVAATRWELDLLGADTKWAWEAVA
jgi:hypothetical protein